MKPRHLLLTLALAATLMAAFWPRPQEAEVVGAAVRKPHASNPPHPRPLSRPRERDEMSTLGAMRADLFPPQTWQPPPPPAAKRVEPPPLAPPLPFHYLGRWKEGGGDVIFLDQGGRVLQARVGDTLAGWHLDQVGDDALVFTWISLNMRQTLRISP